MKHIKQTISGLLAMLLLCCGCASTGTNEALADAAAASMITAEPMAQQTSTSGFTDVER